MADIRDLERTALAAAGLLAAAAPGRAGMLAAATALCSSSRRTARPPPHGERRSATRLAASLPAAVLAATYLVSGAAVALAADSTRLVSVSTAGKQGNGLSTAPSVSGDGRLVVFDSQATNFVHPDTTGGFDDIFLRDRATGKTVLSVSSAGVQGFGQSADPLISRNGRFVAFESAAANLVPGDTNKKTDVFLRDLN